MKHKLAFLTSHPVQYHAPIYKTLANHPQIDLVVYYCWDFGVKETFDQEFNQKFKWDIPLLKGYKFKFLKNFSLKPYSDFWGQINPGIINELIKNKYDAVVVSGYATLTSWFAFLGAWITKTPIILKGEANFSRGKSHIKNLSKKIILRNLFKKIDAFLYGYSLNKEFYKFYGVSEKKLFFYPCSVDNDFFQQKAKELQKQGIDKIKKSLGIRRINYPNILFSGKLIPRKRWLDLLRACKILFDKGTNFNLLVVGDGPDRDRFEFFIEENRLKNIYLSGFKNQSELPKYYFVADIFVLPSEYDPSPKVVNEAMNFKLPIVVSSGVGTGGDLIKHDENGFIYDVGDINVLAEYLEKILLNHKLRDRFGKRSLEMVKEWNNNKNADGISNAVKYILNKKQANN
jgi:glycosyltransferase involved in cell wall biosynthesis